MLQEKVREYITFSLIKVCMHAYTDVRILSSENCVKLTESVLLTVVEVCMEVRGGSLRSEGVPLQPPEGRFVTCLQQ